ncbi:uncharacterized protein LOC128984689 [Macrosteles quadrilineatus]|uniref:uncharacterized protein LOC128984689 n=1 Tax=Macrosteles quadrilineatus TaxID=74068 RepID=UPI0023E1181F|nr:uncharacterized protein LOC128984689 [Macrosteles quadrilineatus]
MDPGDVPPQLQDLTPAEQMLIAKVQPVIRLYQYRSCGQIFYNGHVINIAQDLSEITHFLPRAPNTLNVVIVRRPTSQGFLEFRVRRQKILDALIFLKHNNDFYNDINIDMDTLNDLPIDGTIEEQVPTIEIDSELNDSLDDGLKKNGGGFTCRFGYPKSIEEESHLEKNENGDWVYTPKRNDELINDYNPFVAHVWRANTDCKVVTSLQMVVNYLAKYASKSEPTSQSFRDIFSELLQTSEPTNYATTALQRTLMKLIGQRDISACEVMRLLTGKALYHSSRQFITLYISKEEFVVLNENGDHGSSTFSKYQNRPRLAENMTLYQFTSSCNTNSRVKRLTYYRQPRIVQVLPKVTLGISEEHDELYYMQKVLVVSAFREIIEAKTHSTWKETYEHLDVELWDFDGVADDDDEVEVVNPEIDRIPWMEAAAVPHNVVAEHVHPGEREVGRDYDWFERISAYDNIHDNLNFVKHVSKATQLGRVRANSSEVLLNQEQQQIIDQLKQQLNGQTNIKRSLIIGPAGVGKSVVINEIIKTTESTYGDGSVLILAPTGCAASNVNGQTIHSALRLNIRNFNELQGENERNLQILFENVRVVVCDEISMCGQKLLAMIDKRLRQAKPEDQDEVFGGLIVYLCGDMAQLLPVQDRALFMPADLSNQWSFKHGRFVYEHIQKVFQPKTIMRQAGEEQSHFRDVLNNIAHGKITEEDYKFFSSRFISKNTEKIADFCNAVRIMARKEDVATYNLKELAKLQSPVAFIRAINKPLIAATASSDECQALENTLRLAKGCKFSAVSLIDSLQQYIGFSKIVITPDRLKK